MGTTDVDPPVAVERPPAGWRAPVVLLAACALVQFLFLRPPWPSDSLNYFKAARDYPDVAMSHQQLRIGLTLPVRAAQALFGYSEAAYYLVPLVVTAVLLLAIYRLGAQFFGRPAGFVAALLLLLTPVHLSMSTQIAPDPMAAALVTLAISLLTVLRTHRGADGQARTDRRAVVRLVAAGLLLAWAYLAREYAAFLFPIVPVLFRLWRIPWRWLWIVATPMVAVLLLECGLNSAFFDAPLARAAVTLSHGSTGEAGGVVGGQLAAHASGSTRLDAVLRLPEAIYEERGLGGPLLGMWLAAIAVGLPLTRHRGLALLAAWFLLLWVPLTVLGGLLDPAQPLFRAGVLRYWILTFPALYVGGVGASVLLWRRLSARLRGATAFRGAMACLLIAVAAAAVLAMSGMQATSYRIGGATQLGELRRWLASGGRDVDVLWTDSRTARVLPLYARTWDGTVLWDGEVRAFDTAEGFARPSEVRGDAIVLYWVGQSYLERSGGLLAEPGSRLPDHLARPGDGWTTAVRRADDSLVVYVRGERPPPPLPAPLRASGTR